MIDRRKSHWKLGAAAAITLVALSLAPTTAGQQAPAAPALDKDDLGGVVTGPKGPEAGVWVIAETTDLPTKFAKIVVTDDRGRYLVPDLPKANYSVWVRGYGLVDSPKVKATPGKPLNLTAVAAPDARAAAEYYPAGYWFSLMRVPDKSEFPGTGPAGNGISPNMKSQAEWLRMTEVRHAAGRVISWATRPRARSPPRWGSSTRRRMRGSGASSPGRRARR